MKIKIVLLISTLVFISGCFFTHIEGEFKTDQEMTDFLVENISEFNSLVELKSYCNTLYNVDNSAYTTNDCQRTLDSLKVIYYDSYDSYDENNTNHQYTTLRTYADTSGVLSGRYKGYQYRTKPVKTEDLWSSNLNGELKCYTGLRIIKAGSSELLDNWYIYTDSFCD